MPLTILSALPVLFFSRRRSTTFHLTLVAMILMILALLITVLIEVPIDNMTKVWTIETLPANWMALRQEWEFFHVDRTFLSIGAFGFLLAGALSSSEKPK